MSSIPKVLIFIGIVLVIIGLLWQIVGKILPLGSLPGDILFKKGNTTFYFPIVTSIVISLVISLILYVIGKFR